MTSLLPTLHSSAATGYRSSQYVAALAERGEVVSLPRSGGWLVSRTVPDSDLRDAAAPYPMLACDRWSELATDLDHLDPSLVSVCLVTDPFGAVDAAQLARTFRDRCIRYKEHLVTDLSAISSHGIARHHARNVRRAFRRLEVEVVPTPLDRLEDWVRLYACLVRRHAIEGIADFSRRSLAAQLQVPGVVMLRATREGRTVGMNVWYQHDRVAYYHLGAYDDEGYRDGAAFALFATALSHFRDRVAWLSLGAGAGVQGNTEDGLTRFKRGWATGSRTAWFCGRILDRRAYDALVVMRGTSGTDFFPAYRAGRAQVGRVTERCERAQLQAS